MPATTRQAHWPTFKHYQTIQPLPATSRQTTGQRPCKNNVRALPDDPAPASDYTPDNRATSVQEQRSCTTRRSSPCQRLHARQPGNVRTRTTAVKLLQGQLHCCSSSIWAHNLLSRDTQQEAAIQLSVTKVACPHICSCDTLIPYRPYSLETLLLIDVCNMNSTQLRFIPYSIRVLP